MLRSLSVVAVLSIGVLGLTGCTAAAPAQPPGSSTPGPDATPTPTDSAGRPAASAVYSAGQARVLLPADADAAALTDAGARPDPLAPFELTTVGESVSDAHLFQSVQPAMCGIVNGLWYASASDRSVTDPLLALGFSPTDGSDGSTAVEAVRVFPSTDAASAHFADLVDSAGSCTAFTLTDTQAGTAEYTTSDVDAEADELAFRQSTSGDGSSTQVVVRVRLVGNLLATVTAVGPGGTRLADAVDGFAEDRVATLAG